MKRHLHQTVLVGMLVDLLWLNKLHFHIITIVRRNHAKRYSVEFKIKNRSVRDN